MNRLWRGCADAHATLDHVVIYILTLVFLIFEGGIIAAGNLFTVWDLAQKSLLLRYLTR